MIVYEELVRRLRELASIPEHCEDVESCYQCPKEGICLSFTNKQIIEVVTQVADAIEELQAQLMYSNDAAKAIAEKVPKWIPVTERLPEERLNTNTLYFEYVLCATIWGDVRPFEFGTPFGWGEPHFWNRSRLMDEYVTHWMPLPEPPKEEEK